MKAFITPVSQKISRQLLSMAFAFAGIIALGGSIFFFNAKPNIGFLYTGNFPENTKGEIIVESAMNTELLSFHNGKASAPQHPLTPPYKITASFRLPGDSYRDFIFAIDKAGKELAIRIDGFHPRDKVSLALDGRTQDTVQTDWSGRLELNAKIDVDDKNPTACIQIRGRNDSMHVCHTLVGVQHS